VSISSCDDDDDADDDDDDVFVGLFEVVDAIGYPRLWEVIV